MKIKLLTLSALGFILLTLVVPMAVLAKPSVLSQDSTRGAVIKDKWQKITEEFGQKKEEFLKARLRLGPKATEGEKKDALVKAKEFALKGLDRAVARIEKISERVEKSPVLTGERKQKLQAELKTQIDLLKAKRAQIEVAKNGEELRAVLKETRAQLVSTREVVKKIVLAIIASHLDGTLVKLEDIANRLENQINILSSQGVNITKFQSQLVDGRAKITQARQANTNNDWRLARKRTEEARAILVKLRGQIKAQQAKLKVATKSVTPTTKEGSI